MWSNKKKKRPNRSANIKSYLGGLHGVDVDSDGINNDHDSHQSSDSKMQSYNPQSAQPPVSVLVEIPEEFDIAPRFPSRNEKRADRLRSPSNGANQKQRERDRRRADAKDSAAIAEIGNNIMDLDNYMLSVFHDDSSVYTKATTDTSYSSSASSCSTASTRRRHRGACRNRRGDSRRSDDSARQSSAAKGIVKGSNWLDSMKKSSMNIFADGEDAWTPSKGWRTAPKKTPVETKPQGNWNHWDPAFDDPVFDSTKQERLEI